MTRCVRYRSVFISDIHLGTPDCKAEYLLDFLDAVSCQTLYLVGDIIDLEYMHNRMAWQSSHTAVVDRLLTIAAGGTRVVYIPGNHDAPMRRLVGQTIHGVEVRLEAVHRCADGRRFLVSHGDEFDHVTHPGGLVQKIGDHGYRALSLANRVVNRLRRGVRKPYWPMAVVAKSRFARVREYLTRFERCAAQSAIQRGLDGYIGGHIHFGGIRRIDGVLYCNDGDWTDHCTALVEDASGQLDLLHWSDRVGLLRETPLYDASAPVLPMALFAAMRELEVSGVAEIRVRPEGTPPRRFDRAA